jgi:hypothetical protein
MKKSRLLVSLMIALCGFSYANAQEQNASYTSRSASVTNADKAGQFGVGLEAGSLPGINFEYWMANDRSLNGTIAFYNGNTEISLAHLWVFRNAFSNLSGDPQASYFAPYIGAGALLGFGTSNDEFSRNIDTNAAVAAQVPLGIAFLPSQQRFSIFAELAPTVEIAPVGTGFITADLGAKFFF